MDAANIFTRKNMGLDNNVWFTLLFLLLASAILSAYNLAKGDGEIACKPIDIYMNGQKNLSQGISYVGEPLSFRTPVSAGNNVTWDFGDNTRVESGFAAIHVFNKEAIYRVRAIVNGKCEYELKVTVRNQPAVVRDSVGNITEYIIGEDHANEKEAITFTTRFPAKDYKWYIENNRNYPQISGNTATYTFRTPGTYMVVLMLDNDREKKYMKSVLVLESIKLTKDGLPAEKPGKLITDIQPADDPEPAPVPVDTVKAAPPKPEVPRYKKLENSQWKVYLQSMVCKEMNVKDFDAYLCQGGATPVIINGKERKTFAAMCGEIQGKKFEVEMVAAAYDANCVINLAVKLDKKGFMGGNPCKK